MHSSREYPDYPFVGVGALIHKGGRVLLIKRKFEPNEGKWSLPGGLVEKGENVEDAARREVREELGIRVRLEGLIQVANEIILDDEARVKYHFVLLDYLARHYGGRIRLNRESSSYRWFEPEVVKNLNASRNTKLIVRKYVRERKRLDKRPRRTLR